MIDPEIGFTSSIIKDPKRFVGRRELIRSCIRAINNPLGLIAVYGKRGVGKSSLLRQVQQMALGNYNLAEWAGLQAEIPARPRKYLTAYYQCDSLISEGESLLSRLCNDQDDEDGLLRLVPNDGKEIVEFTRTKEINAGADLKVVNWGTKGIEASKYVRVVQNDIVQTFRNFILSIIKHQVTKRMKRDGLLILLDEFDVIKDKSGIGSLVKSLSSNQVKFGICGIGRDTTDLVEDHASVERLLEQGAIYVQPMPPDEIGSIIVRAEELFKGEIKVDQFVKNRIVELSHGYPYFAQMLGKQCVEKANHSNTNQITQEVFNQVLEDIKNGKALPTLENAYQKAIGNSEDRQLLLHLLADQPEENTMFNVDIGKVYLKHIRKDAEELDLKNLDQNLPRLLDQRFGPILVKVPERPGTYEFVNPVLRLYVRLRKF